MGLYAGLAVIALVLMAIFCGFDTMPRRFQDVKCQGKGWREAFPDASNEEIREFLESFACAFGFKSKDKLQLHPSDEIFSIYKALHPKTWMLAALEMETLVEKVQEQYGVDLAAVWKDNFTLGDLFSVCRAASAQQGAPGDAHKGARS